MNIYQENNPFHILYSLFYIIPNKFELTHQPTTNTRKSQLQLTITQIELTKFHQS